MEDFVPGKNARSCAASNGFSEDAVAVMVVQDQNVVVADAGRNNEPAGLVGVYLSIRWLNDGSETLMCFVIFGIAVREQVEVERRLIRKRFGLGGSLVFATLIKVVTLDHRDRLWGMLG